MPAADESFDTGLRPGDVDPARPQPLDTAWGTLSIFTVEGELRAVQSYCPHLLGPLFQGTVAGGAVTCPWHQWRFSLRTGERLDTPATGGGLLVCDVARGTAGTLILSRPRRAASRAAPAP